MAWLDAIFLGIVLLSVVIGMFRGFVREALSLASWILAFVAALSYGPMLTGRLHDSIHTPALRIALGYALVFFGAMLVGAVITYLVGILVRNAGLRPVDRMLGSGFGLLRGALLVVGFVMLAGITSLHENSWWQQSRLAPELRPAADSLQSLIPSTWLAYLQPDAKPGNQKPGDPKSGDRKSADRKSGDLTVFKSER